MSSTEKAVQHASKIGVLLLKHVASNAIGDETVNEIADTLIDIIGDEATTKFTSWLNQPVVVEKINSALQDAETCMREDPHLPTFVRQKLHATGQTGGFFKNDEHLVKAIGKITSTTDEEQLLKEVIAAFQAVDDFHQFKGDEAEYTAQKFLQCLRHGIVRHLKGDWQENILNQAVLYTEEQIKEVAPIINEMAEQLDRMEEILKAIYTKIVQEPSSTIGQIPQLPAPPTNFTGREEDLEKLRAQRQHQIIILHGAPGIGKTALALQYAHEIKDDYSDGQIYLNLRGTGDTKPVPGTPSYDPEPLTTVQILTHILIDLGVPVEAIPTDENQLHALYRQKLNGKKLLILLDNDSNKDQVETVVNLTPDNIFLITSRQEFYLCDQKPIHLEKMNEEEAVQLLQKICADRKIIKEEALQLAQELGYLPLALRLASNTLNQKQYLSVEEYLNRLQNQNEKLSLIESAVEISLVELPSSPIDYAKLWIELAVFAGDFHPKIAEQVCPIERYIEEKEEPSSAYEDFLHTFQNYGLLERNSITNRYGYHDLLREYARSQWTTIQKEVLPIYHSVAIRNIIYYANYLFMSSEGDDKLRNKQRQKALIIYIQEENELIESLNWLLQLSNLQSSQFKSLYIDLCLAGANLLDLHMPSTLRIKYLEKALQACEEIDDQPNICPILGNLSSAYLKLGDIQKAIKCDQKGLEIARQIGDKHLEGIHLNNLGVEYKHIGEIDKAINHISTALAIHRTIENQNSEQNDLNNLGNIFIDIGEVHKAIECYKMSYDIAKEIGDRRVEGTSIGNLGNAYRILGKTQVAIKYLEDSINIAHEIGNQTSESNQLNNLGKLYADLDELIKAKEICERALQISREINYPSGECHALSFLGMVFNKLGKTEEAIQYFQLSLEISQKIHDRQAEESNLGNLGIVYRFRGDTSTAISYLEQALLISHDLQNSRNESIHLGNLGNIFADNNHKEKAIIYYEQALEIAQKIGDKYTQSAHFANLGQVYAEDKQFLLAIENYYEAYKIAYEIGNFREQVDFLVNLGMASFDFGETAQGLEYLKKAYILSAQIQDNQRIARCSFIIAQLLAREDPQTAHQLLCQAYHIWTQMGVPEREDALALMQKWGLSPADCDTIEA